MKKPPTIVKQIHRGTVAAIALHIDARLIGEGTARARVLRLWQPTCQVRRTEDGYLLVFSAPVVTDCRVAPGLPFTRQGDVIAAMPLSDVQLETLALPRDTVAMFRRGQFETAPLTSFETVDPAAWLDVSNFQVVTTATLGAKPRPARVVVEPAAFDGRKQLKNIPEAAPEQAEILEELRRRAARGFSPMPGDEKDAASPGVRGLFERLARWFGGDDQPPRTPSGTTIENPLFNNYTASEPSWLSKQAKKLFEDFLLKSRLAQLYGRRQAEYIEKMMDMFDRGDWQDALRHAIPMGGEKGEGGGIFFGLPTARGDLKINLGSGTGSGGSINLGTNVFEEIRNMYRAAFQRLDAQGKHEEAAFILAELLREYTEAVTYLERHGKHREAAMLAEARELPPSLVIRLWLQAGDTRRAVMLARRHKAFGEVVTHLESRDPELANKLRLLWADSLADAGDYGQAVMVIWPVTEARHIAADWMRRVIDAGGKAGAEMLARYLVEFSDQPGYVEKAFAILEDELVDTAPERTAFASILIPHHTARLIPFKRAAIRALLRDFGNADLRVPTTWTLIRKLIDNNEDGGITALRADLPPQPAEIPQSTPKAIEMTLEANDCGALPVHDAIALPNGRTLVALGEAGARLLSRNGRTMFHFNVPTHRFAIATHGNSALAVADRGEFKRIARLDLIRGTARDWCDAEISTFADTFEGNQWYVASRGDVLMIDPTAERFDALWRIPDLGVVSNLTVTTSHLIFDSKPKGSEETETFKYLIPACRLLERTQPPKSERARLASGISPIGLRLMLTTRESATKPGQVFPCLLAFEGEREKLEIPMPDFHHLLSDSGGSFACDAALSAMTFHCIGETVVVSHELSHYRLLATFRLQNSKVASVRFFGTLMTVADDRGRVIVVDPRKGVVARELRI